MNSTIQEPERRASVFAVASELDPTQMARREDQSMYIWKPAACILKGVNSSVRGIVCGEMQKWNYTGILIIGDSISKQFAISLIGALGGTRQGLPKREGELGLGGNSLGAHGAFSFAICGNRKLTYIRNDALSMSPFDNGGVGSFHTLHWADAELLSQYSIVVANSGAHRVTDEQFVEFSATAARFLEQHVPSPRILIYRNTVPGHGSCANLSSPFSTVDEAEGYLASHGWYTMEQFVKRLNRFAKSIFLNHGFEYLDAYAVTVLRGDQHGSATDCLHYHLPGPTDLWVDAFSLLVVGGGQGVQGQLRKKLATTCTC